MGGTVKGLRSTVRVRGHRDNSVRLVDELKMEYSYHQGVESEKILIRIADIPYAIASVDPRLKLQIPGATRHFILDKGIPEFTTETRWDDLSRMEIKGEKIFDSGAVWRLYQNKENYIFSFHSPSLGPLPYKMAEVKKDFTWCEVLFHRPYFDPDQPIYPLEYPLDELLFIHFLALGRGVEIHASGVIDSLGRGHLFVGQSEAGKTTISRLWQDEPGITVLSDDRIILRKTSKGLWMYGTPWHGEAKLASPAGAPLTRVYFLRKGFENQLIPLCKAESAGYLFVCSFLPFYNPGALDFTLVFFEEVVKAVPCFDFKFVPDKKAVEFINRTAA